MDIKRYLRTFLWQTHSPKNDLELTAMILIYFGENIKISSFQMFLNENIPESSNHVIMVNIYLFK